MHILEDIIKKHNIEYEMIEIPYSSYEDGKIKTGAKINFLEVSPENLKKIKNILKEEKND
jgi:uncharacterized protein YajQ (UPF0234 family)